MGDLDSAASKVILYGSSGFLGGHISQHLKDRNLVTFDRSASEHSELLEENSVNGVVFAQGVNHSSHSKLNATLTRDSLEANVIFILDRVAELVDSKALTQGASLVVISSIWQIRSRSGKLPYVISKSSLSGLVSSVVSELAGKARVNAILPGVIDSPMARQALTPKQLDFVKSTTPGGQLASPTDVLHLIDFLLSANSAGVNGQSIAVDFGWTANLFFPEGNG